MTADATLVHTICSIWRGYGDVGVVWLGKACTAGCSASCTALAALNQEARCVVGSLQAPADVWSDSVRTTVRLRPSLPLAPASPQGVHLYLENSTRLPLAKLQLV